MTTIIDKHSAMTSVVFPKWFLFFRALKLILLFFILCLQGICSLMDHLATSQHHGIRKDSDTVSKEWKVTHLIHLLTTSGMILFLHLSDI